MILRNARPLQLGQFGFVLRRAHIGPDQASMLARGVRRGAQLVSESVLRRLVGHIHARAAYVELPSVIHAPQTALFVTSPKEAGSAMRAKLVDQAYPAVRVAERQQIFPEHPDSNRGAVRS